MITKRTLDPALRKRFVDAAWSVYNAIGYDAWGERIPSDNEFVCVISDQMCHEHNSGLTSEECDQWIQVSSAEQRRICLEVGP